MKNFWWTIWIFNLIQFISISCFCFINGNVSAGIPWLVATLCVILILIQQSKRVVALGVK